MKQDNTQVIYIPPGAEYVFLNGKRYCTVEHMADQMLMAYETGRRARKIISAVEAAE